MPPDPTTLQERRELDFEEYERELAEEARALAFARWRAYLAAQEAEESESA